MARSVFDPEVRAEIRERLSKLAPGTPRRWGEMTAPRMLAHLTDSARLCVEKGEGRVPSGPFTRWPLKHVFLYWLPWPRGKVKGPKAAFVTEPGAWEADRARFEELLDALERKAATASWPAHPLFGRMTREEWGVLTYRHTDHHLKQFGA